MAIKKLNPSIATYFYANAFHVIPEMPRLYREIEEYSNYFLPDGEGNHVRNSEAF